MNQSYENGNIFKRILNELDGRKLEYTLLKHEPTLTSSDSHIQVNSVIGNEKRIGGKALVLKVDQTFRLFIINSALKLDQKKIKTFFQAKRLRFASPEELFELTELVPGCVPPFGRPLLPIDIYTDPSVFLNDKISFNAGSLTDSVIMKTSDWKDMVQPNVFEFADNNS